MRRRQRPRGLKAEKIGTSVCAIQNSLWKLLMMSSAVQVGGAFQAAQRRFAFDPANRERRGADDFAEDCFHSQKPPSN